ncbi:GPI transamidase component PIG-T like protein [Danaus plexippus plexippus]|uniref:GPI transamidase component PIG-T like protein n=1 Tax=Danaus plexippus plexippus TaxID=278856 RepID=A0A212FJX6_DANPL|nr:GPI transamidase component PIG-T like protein [Danaus plexippus plexippus]
MWRPEFITFFLLFATLIHLNKGDEFREEIFIKPLPPSHLYVYFQFITVVDEDSNYKHSHLAPQFLLEIMSNYQVDELHLTLTEGQWKHSQWGYPILDAAPGAELYAWFAPDVVDIDNQWKKLSSTLSGLFCASLNFIESFNTISPKMALWPTGATTMKQNVTSHLRYASLPREIVCTENLTPWKKLLPCGSNHGFASLLNSRMIHNTNYHSIGMHVRRICDKNDCLETKLEVKQTVALVYDFKIIYSSDWSFRKLFGQGLPGACPLSSSSKIYVDITSNNTYAFKLSPEPTNKILSVRGGSDTELAVYEINNNNTEMMNIVAKYESPYKITVKNSPPVTFNRYVLGYGKEFGGIVTELTNNYWAPIDIVLLENAPWWLPIQLSTLRINGEAESNLIMSQYYSPGRSRQKPYHLELLIKLPPKSTTTVTIDFEFVFLKWQEYPPDANHGFYIGSAIISANLPTAKNYTSLPITGSTFDSIVNASKPWYPIVLRTNGAMVSLPTPDFSMPYNVICLACTVVALAFGPLHNICTKELVLKAVGTAVSLRQKITNIFKKKIE